MDRLTVYCGYTDAADATECDGYNDATDGVREEDGDRDVMNSNMYQY